MRRSRGHPVFAALYDLILHRAEKKFLASHRAYLAGRAVGRVLDVGSGTGMNFGYYPPGTEVVGIEPDRHMLKRAQTRAARLGRRVVLLAEAAEALPFPDASFDVAVATLVFCTIADLDRALAELRRVLRPGGQLRFLEHVRAANARWARFQDFVTPLWKRIGAGCHPNRDTVGAITRARFRIEELDHYAFGPYPVRPFVRGVAILRTHQPEISSRVGKRRKQGRDQMSDERARRLDLKLSRREVILGILGATGALSVRSAAGGPVTTDRVGDQIQTLPRNEPPEFVKSMGPEVRAAYRYAVEQGRDLEYIPCFCGCKNIGHRHNRDCYLKSENRDGTVTYTSHAAT